MQQITDPRTLPQNFYLISKSGVDFLSSVIQWWTGLWNHSMNSRKQGLVVWQGLQIVEKPIALYMKKYTRLDFFTIKGLTSSALSAMNEYIDKRMSGAWYSQTYDFLGIFGQILKQPWIHTPGLDYCSVFELSILRVAVPFMPKSYGDVITNQPPESNPQNLHDMYVKNPDVFSYDYYYESDEGTIV